MTQAAVPSLNHAQYLPVAPPTYSWLLCAGPPWPLLRGPGVLRRAHSQGGGAALSVCPSLSDPSHGLSVHLSAYLRSYVCLSVCLKVCFRLPVTDGHANGSVCLST
jgi:hypothetical protein